jgi:hypothetical protein
MKKVRHHQPVSSYVRIALCVGETWAVVYSFKRAEFFVEDLCSAVEKNHRSFVEGAGEDYQLIGIFPSPQEAAEAVNAWMKTPGKRRMDRRTPGNIREPEKVPSKEGAIA